MSSVSPRPPATERPTGEALRDRWDLTRRRHVDFARCDSQGCRLAG